MSDLLRHLFVPDAPFAEQMLRPFLVYAFLVIALRLGGKRQLAELSPLDLVVALTLSNAVQNALVGPDQSVTGGALAGGVLLAMNYAAARFIFRRRRLDRLVEGEPTVLVEGEPTVLVEGGQPRQDVMERELITDDHLLAAVRAQGAERIEDVERAILETSGSISVFVRNGQIAGADDRSGLDALAREMAALREAVEALGRRLDG